MLSTLRKIRYKQILRRQEKRQKSLLSEFKKNGSVPWSAGYVQFKKQEIDRIINSPEILDMFSRNELPDGYGKGLDDRIVEYPFVFSRLRSSGTLLDAGSVLNFKNMVEHEKVLPLDLTIFNYNAENYNYNKLRISYVYGDLRDVGLRSEWFDQIVCVSTLEHIDMDNSEYGWNDSNNQLNAEKSYDFKKVVSELNRLLKPGGQLLLTFPYGKFENHGWFQQFDKEMVSHIQGILEPHGTVKMVFFKYEKHGWIVADQNLCNDSISYNPKTGAGKSDDGAAHSRSICAIQFVKP